MSATSSVLAENDLPVRGDADVGRVFPSGVRVGRTSYGLGVFSFALISKGTPIGRVPGTLIHDPDYGSDYCISAGEGSVLDPGPPFCYLNHSCDPNCQLMQYVREDDATEEELEVGELAEDDMELDDENGDEAFDDEECYFGDGAAAELDGVTDEMADEDENADEEDITDSPLMRFETDKDAEIWVESIRDILPGEELTIDYAWPADRAMRCLCGSRNCRGWIVDPVELHLLENEA